jgi:PIN domain nuclease of toxin-antitoxin system
MILLDTYTLIGVVSEPTRLSSVAKALVEDAANKLFVSAISALEIGIAVQKNRLALNADSRTWFELALDRQSIEPIDVTWQIAAASFALPKHHADPSDRLIIATALLRGLILLTPDKDIHRYTEVRVVW